MARRAHRPVMRPAQPPEGKRPGRLAVAGPRFASRADANRATAGTSAYGSVFRQLLSGLNDAIADAISGVREPRSFSYTMPSWLQVKVITPDTP